MNQKLEIEELKAVIDKNSNERVNYENQYVIDLTFLTINKNYKGKSGQLILFFKENEPELDLISFDTKDILIEKKNVFFVEKINSQYKALLSFFKATEPFSKNSKKFTEEDILNHFKKVKFLFKKDIYSYKNKVKPNTYKLTIYYEWKQKRKALVEMSFSLENNLRDTLLIQIDNVYIKELTTINDWYNFIGKKEHYLNYDKQFYLIDNKKIFLNLPFSHKSNEPYYLYLKRYFKEKYTVIDSDYRNNIILTYELTLN